MCWCWWSQRIQSKICPIWCLGLTKAVIINKTDRVDVDVQWMVLFHLRRLKTSVYQGTVQEPPLLVGDRRLWLSLTQALRKGGRGDRQIFWNKLLRVEIDKIDPGAPPGTWRPKLIWKNVWGNQSEIYEVDTIGILFECGKKNTECNMVSIKMIPFVDTLNWLVWKWFKFR